MASTNMATAPGERVFLDLSVVTVPWSDGGSYNIHNKNWKGIKNQATDKKRGGFTSTKIGIV